MSINTRRRGLTALVATLLAMAAALANPTPAKAAGYFYHTPGTSYSWYDFDLVDDWMHLQSHPSALATGKCYDTLFDWDRGWQHYDSRLARTCVSWTVRNTQRSNEPDTVDLVNVQKLGACYGINQQTNIPYSNCIDPIGGVNDINTQVGSYNLCVRAWSMTGTATGLQYFNGGNPTSCTS